MEQTHHFQRTFVTRREQIERVGGFLGHHRVVHLLAVLAQPLFGITLDRLRLHFELDVYVVLVGEEVHQLGQEDQVVALVGLDLADLVGRHRLHHALAGRQTCQRLVVRDHQLAVAGHADVGLETAQTRIVGGIEGRQRVFVVLETAAPMSEELDDLLLRQRLGGTGERQCADTQFQKEVFHKLIRF